jgi:hypothetical protein
LTFRKHPRSEGSESVAGFTSIGMRESSKNLLFFFFQISLPSLLCCCYCQHYNFSSVDDAPKEAFTFALISSSNKTLRPFVVHFHASDSAFVILRVQRSDKIILSLYQETHSFHSPFSNKEKIYWCQQTLTDQHPLLIHRFLVLFLPCHEISDTVSEKFSFSRQ